MVQNGFSAAILVLVIILLSFVNFLFGCCLHCIHKLLAQSKKANFENKKQHSSLKTIRTFYQDFTINFFNENGNEPVLMYVDNEYFPLKNIANYETYLGLKPLEKEAKVTIIKKVKAEGSTP